MQKITVLLPVLVTLSIALFVATGCPQAVPPKVQQQELGSAIIGTWRFDAETAVFTFNPDGTLQGTFNGTDAAGAYSVRDDLIFVDLATHDLSYVYTVFSMYEGSIYTDGGEQVIPWIKIN